MTNLRQAAQQALEALEDERYVTKYTHIVEAITALQTALAQPEQQAEPCIGKDPRCPCQDGDACHYKDCGNTKARPVAQSEQEPTQWRDMVVVTLVREGINKHKARELADHFATPLAAAQPEQQAEPIGFINSPGPITQYIIPTQRPWVGLTDEDRRKFAAAQYGWEDLLVAAEAKLKERNRGATTHCQCAACKNGNIHDSDCSVHNGDALPVGPCDCSLATPPVYQPAANEAVEILKSLGYVYKPTCTGLAWVAKKSAQPEQEPVAYDKTEINCFVQDLYDQKMQEGKHGHYETMFHVVHQAIKKVAPPAAQPEQQAEPVAWITPDGEGWRIRFSPPTIGVPLGWDALYTAAPAAQRPWVGLEAEDLAQIESDEFWQVKNHMAIAIAVEAKLKERNGY